MNTRILHRSLIAAGLLVVGAIAAPAAFARSHVSIGLGFYGPGYTVGYNNCVNCYYGHTYYSPAYNSGYYDPGYITYYDPGYTTYYNPAPVYYDSYPAYGAVYYGSGYYGGGYYGGGYYGRGHYGRHHNDRGWHGRGDHRGYDRGDHHHWHGH